MGIVGVSHKFITSLLFTNLNLIFWNLGIFLGDKFEKIINKITLNDYFVKASRRSDYRTTACIFGSAALGYLFQIKT